MKVKELIEALQNYDPDMSVYLGIDHEWHAPADSVFIIEHEILGEIVAIDTPLTSRNTERNPAMPHPLDQAVNNATFGNSILTPLECLPDNTPSEWLLDLTQVAAETFFPQTRRAHLRSIAIDTCEWLQTLGPTDPWQAMRDEYDQLHTSNKTPVALDKPTLTDKTRYLRLIAQIGRIAYTLDDDEAATPDEMAPEITRLGAQALAWLTHEITQEQQ